MVRTWCAFHILSSRCALCQNGHNSVHFFKSSTSKNAPTLWCSCRFDLEMCFSPQPRALFQHLSSQKCTHTGVIYHFASKCASCHGGVLFDPPEPQITKHWKTQRFAATFLPSAHFDLLSSGSFSSLTHCSRLSPLLFHLSILPEV